MKKFVVVLIAALLATASFAQEVSFRPDEIVSPQVNPDNTVTFRLLAPEAEKVEITGDFLPPKKIEKIQCSILLKPLFQLCLHFVLQLHYFLLFYMLFQKKNLSSLIIFIE